MSWSWTRRRWLGASVAGLALSRELLAERPEQTPWLTDRRLPNEPERLILTQAYLDAHLPDRMVGTVDPVRMLPRVVVLHWTGSGSAEGVFETFAPARLAGRAELQAAGSLNVASHFIMNRNGVCWCVLDEIRVARHTIGLNHCAIGIENVGDGPVNSGSAAPLTLLQVERNAALVRGLVKRHPTIQWLIGHHEYRRMESTPLFAERDPSYRTTKIDPGAAFMSAVRAKLADLPLLAPPP